MIPGVAVIGGFVVTSLLSIFILQSGINASHQSKLSQALAEEIAQQVNIKETQLIEQLTKIATSAMVTNAISGTIDDLSAAELTIAQLLPFAEKVRLIPTGQAIIDQGFPPFNFVALDMVKASNTEPALTLRFEADSDESLENIKSAFRELLQEVKSDLNFE